MQILRALVLALGLAPLPAFADGAAPPAPLPRPDVNFPPEKVAYPGGVSAQFDIAYATPAADHPLTLDLYTPKPSPTPLPFVLFVHGGGWDSGDSRHALAFADLPHTLADLAAQGYVVASVNYRLSQNAPFPAALQDVKAAIRWLRGHASDYGGDNTRIAVWGMSAGGQLAAMAGTACGVARFEPNGKIDYTLPSDCAEAVIDWFGPTDLAPSGTDDKKPASTPEGRYLGCEPAACAPGIVHLASPMAFISENTPPFLIQHGQADTTVAPAQSQALYDALKKRNVPAEIVMYPDVGHGFQKDGKPDAATVTQAMDKVSSFLAATFPRPPIKPPAKASPPRRGVSR